MDQEQINKIVDLLVQKNPDLANNPRAKAAIEVIKSGDEKKGTEMALNLCKTYGATKEEGINLAMSWVQGLLGGGGR